MELRHLRYFVAVAEELHFGRAAKRAGISQPPLSQQIRALEKELGTRLFDRTKHKVELTQAGTTMLPEAYHMLEQADRLLTVGLRARSTPQSRLKIGCVLSVLFDVLPPILDRLRAEHPQIAVTLEDCDAPHAIASVQQGRFDLGIVRTGKVKPPLRSLALINDHYIAAMPTRHRLAGKSKVALASLAGEPLIIYARQLSPEPYDAIFSACVKAGFNPDIAYQGRSAQACLGYVACKLGVALVPGALRSWSIPGVVYRELQAPIRTKQVSLVWDDTRRSEAVGQFLRTTKALFPRPR